MSSGLDKAEEHDVGSGLFAAWMYAMPDNVGLRAQVEGRVADDVSAYVEAWAGYARPLTTWDADYGVLGGVRIRW